MSKWVLPGLLTIFAAISLITLQSIAPSLLIAQLIFFCLGAGIFFVVSRLGFELFFAYKWQLYAILLVLLIIPLLMGTITRGTRSWIAVGSFFTIQPSQLAIPLMGLGGAYLITTTKKKSKSPNLVTFLAAVALPALLIITEPDLGTTIVYLASFGALVFISRTPISMLASLLGIGVLSAVFAWFFFLKPYQKARITSFISPSDQSQVANYNAQQAMIAVGSGQLFGRGIGKGIQSHLEFLPERHNDFIFASLAEEWGFMGTSLVLILYTVLLAFLSRLIFFYKSPIHQAYILLTITMITVQTGINIGMNIGILPITGITLPFISYGGSSLLSLFLQLGLIQSIVLSKPDKPLFHLS